MVTDTGFDLHRQASRAVSHIGHKVRIALIGNAVAVHCLHWFRRRAFIVVASGMGGRRSELTLEWKKIHLGGDGSYIVFTRTKGHRDRKVPLMPNVVSALRRLQAMTMQQGGPFVDIGSDLSRQWGRIVDAAGIEWASVHDMRRHSLPG